MKKTFRCTYSEKGTEWLHPQNPYRRGDAYKSGKYTYVRWDKTKTFQSYHPSFIKSLSDDDIYEDGSGWDWDFYCYAMMKKMTDIANIKAYYDCHDSLMPYTDQKSFCSKCGAYRGPTHPGGPSDFRKCPLMNDCGWKV